MRVNPLVATLLAGGSNVLPSGDHFIDVRYINLAKAADRRTAMETMLTAAVPPGTNSSYSRFEAIMAKARSSPESVQANSQSSGSGGTCELSGGSAIMTAAELQEKECPTTSGQSWTDDKCSILGCYLSHLGVLHDYIASNRRSKYLLVAEDDLNVTRAFFDQLPSLLQNVPEPFHIVRFATWAVNETDRLPATVSAANPVYVPRGRPSEIKYLGATAVLYQRETAVQTLNMMLSKCAQPPEALMMMRGDEGDSYFTGSANHSWPAFRSFVMDTPELINIGGMSEVDNRHDFEKKNDHEQP
eukprot:7225831-Prymnesium_polylepis.1